MLRERLPPEIAALLDDRPPEHIAGSFVPAELREYRTDRLYRVRTVTGRPWFVHCIVEHKSAPDPWIGPQLLGYTVQILEWWKRTEAPGEAAPLPAVVSIVVYHGKAEWRVPLAFADTVGAGPEVRPWLVDFRYVLVDLGHIEDARLSRNGVLRVGFLILKYGTRDADLRETLLTLGKLPRIVGIGETGLDYYRLGERTVADMEWQRDRYRTHIRAARQLDLPLVIHTRSASDDTLAILKEEGEDGTEGCAGGVFHCFTETAEVARAALDLGFYISFSGILTFKNAQHLRDVAAFVPLDRILIETDSPYLAPMPYRGKTNNPSYVPHVAAQLGLIKQRSTEDIADITSRNFDCLFKSVLR